MKLSENEYQNYTAILRAELIPAMGCTEPIAIDDSVKKAVAFRCSSFLICLWVMLDIIHKRRDSFLCILWNCRFFSIW